MADILPNPLVRLVHQVTYMQLSRRSKNCASIFVNNSKCNPVGFLPIKFDAAMRSDFARELFNSILLEIVVVAHRSLSNDNRRIGSPRPLEHDRSVDGGRFY